MVYKSKFPEILLNVLMPFLSILVILKGFYLDPIIVVPNKNIHTIALLAVLLAGYDIIRSVIAAFQEVKMEDNRLVVTNSILKKVTVLNFSEISFLKIKEGNSLMFSKIIEIKSNHQKDKTLILKLTPANLCVLFGHLSSILDNSLIDQKSTDFVNKVKHQRGIMKFLSYHKTKIIMFIFLCVFIYVFYFADLPANLQKYIRTK